MKPQDFTDKQRNLIMATLILGGFSTLLCETLLNIAIPTFMSNFNIAATTAQWLISGFILTLGIFMPCSSFLIQNFSTRKLFFAAMSIFIFGGLFAACGVNFPMILTGRLIQAVGISILIPLNQTTILAIYPPEKLGAANGLFILVLMFAPILGPTTSGFILRFFSWRALFLLTIPFNILAFVMAYLNLKNVNDLSPSKLDVLSVILSVLGFGGFIIGLNKINEFGIADPRAYLILLTGIIGLTAFAFRQLKIPNPILNLKIMRYPLLFSGVLFILFNTSCTFGNLILMPIFLQKAMMLSAFSAGLLLLPTAMASALSSPISGRLYDSFGPRVILPLGYIFIISVFSYFSFLDTSISQIALILLLCLINAGVMAIGITVNTHVLKHLPIKEKIDGSVILNTTQQIAASLGSSVFVSLMATGASRFLTANPSGSEADSIVAGVNFAYMLGLVPLIAGFILSFWIKKFTDEADLILENHREKL